MNKNRTFAIILLVTTSLVVIKYGDQIQEHINIDNIQGIVESFGILGGGAFLILATIRPLLFIPSPVFFLLGGVLFGVPRGTLLNVAGLLMGAIICYYLANRFSSFIIDIFGDKYIKRLKKIEERDAIKTLFSMRVTPGFPFDPISYASGISGLKIKYFIIGTFLGSTPKIFIYTLLGDGIKDIFSIQTIIAFVFLLGLALIPLLAKKIESNH